MSVAPTQPAPANVLYYGDNLDVLRRHIPDASVDLVYLDPPFNSAQDYNVLFQARDGAAAEAQIRAFEDTWRWDVTAAELYRQLVEGGGRVSEVMQAFRLFLGESDMLAYLTMMAPRLVELRRVLKDTGSLYLHCDPTASHYLKLLLDAVFGAENYRSEIIWKRTSAHNSAKRFGPVHDVILFYARSDAVKWIGGRAEYEDAYVEARFGRDDSGRRWKDADLTGSGTRNGETGEPWRGFNPTAKGRHWAYPPTELDRLDERGQIHWPKKSGGWPRLKKFLDEADGVPLQDVWADIPPVNAMARERLGYPTQKPLALLERIVSASTEPGDVVLDPFCGCGTAIDAAQRLARAWIGIDITHLAVGLIRNRLDDAFGATVQYRIIGEPTTLEDAAELARQDKFQFQAWALGLVGARPAQGVKKGADGGIDGRLFFHSSERGGKTDSTIISVKGGHLKADDVRALEGVRAREGAAIGVLISFEEPSRRMRTDSAAFGFHETAWGAYPRIQLLTIAELLEGKRIEYPRVTEGNRTFKRAPRVAPHEKTEQPDLGL